MTLGHLSDSAGLNQFHHTSIVVAGMNLSSHLSCHTRSLRGFANNSRFFHAVSQRLFTVHVLTKLQCRKCGKSMSMFARTDHHRIELTGVVEHTPKIRGRSGRWMCFDSSIQVALIYIAQYGDMLRRDRLQITSAAATTSNDSDP